MEQRMLVVFVFAILFEATSMLMFSWILKTAFASYFDAKYKFVNRLSRRATAMGEERGRVQNIAEA